MAMNFRGGNMPMYALGRLPAGTMNKLETAYAAQLELRKHASEIAWYKFEAIKLRLADATFLTVDFFVMLANGELEAHECKGFMTEDANAKLKIAAGMYPFRFYLIRARTKKDGGGFSVEEVGRG